MIFMVNDYDGDFQLQNQNHMTVMDNDSDFIYSQ